MKDRYTELISQIQGILIEAEQNQSFQKFESVSVMSNRAERDTFFHSKGAFFSGSDVRSVELKFQIEYSSIMVYCVRRSTVH